MRTRTLSARRSVVVRAMSGQMLIHVPPHPLAKHWLAVARNSATPPSMFRGALAELGRVLLYEAARELLTTTEISVDTPFAKTTVEFVDPTKPIKLIPVLRSGLVLCEHVESVIPSHEIYHVGIHRDVDSLQVLQTILTLTNPSPQASMYLNTLPERFSPSDQIIILDVMLATGRNDLHPSTLIFSGGSMMLLMEEVIKRDASASNVRIVCAVTAPPALKRLSESFPALQIYAGIIDAEVNDRGWIVPGLGDAGNRAFGNRT